MDKITLFKLGKLVDGNGTPITCAKVEICTHCGKEVLVTYGTYGWNGQHKLCYDCDQKLHPEVEDDLGYYGSDAYFEEGAEAFGK